MYLIKLKNMFVFCLVSFVVFYWRKFCYYNKHLTSIFESFLVRDLGLSFTVFFLEKILLLQQGQASYICGRCDVPALGLKVTMRVLTVSTFLYFAGF